MQMPKGDRVAGTSRRTRSSCRVRAKARCGKTLERPMRSPPTVALALGWPAKTLSQLKFHPAFPSFTAPIPCVLFKVAYCIGLGISLLSWQISVACCPCAAAHPNGSYPVVCVKIIFSFYLYSGVQYSYEQITLIQEREGSMPAISQKGK